MKKTFVFFVVLFVVALSPFFYSCAVMSLQQEDYFIFPSSLEVIEDEAFEGTSVQTIILPKGFLSIGDNAFQDALDITDVFIPESTNFIAEHAFSSDGNITIHGIQGSYAAEWANEHKVLFAKIDIWYGRFLPEHAKTAFCRCVEHERADLSLLDSILSHRLAKNEGKSKRPQDRPELNPIDYRFP